MLHRRFCTGRREQAADFRCYNADDFTAYRVIVCWSRSCGQKPANVQTTITPAPDRPAAV